MFRKICYKIIGVGAAALWLALLFREPAIYRSEPKIPMPLSLSTALFRSGLPAPAFVKGGRLYHNCRRGESARELAKKYDAFSKIYDPRRLQLALQYVNAFLFSEGVCNRNAFVVIPEPILQPLQNRPLGLPKGAAIRAVYLRAENMQPARLLRELERMENVGANGLVFDVKDVPGVVSYRSRAPEIEKYRRRPASIANLEKTIHFLHTRGVYVIARVALFQDGNLAARRPAWAIHDKRGRALLTNGRSVWVDPGRPEVQAYNLRLVQELLYAGVDEIQFDYVRYPAEGDLRGVRYFDVRRTADKTEHLSRFLLAARLLGKRFGVKLGVDIFGVVAWGKAEDIRTTGQDIAKLARYVDVVSPMLYPSHFAPGFGGFRRPADEGFHFYSIGVRKVLAQAPLVTVRPWVQAFGWRVSRYDEAYILDQLRGSAAGGGRGWMMWNAGNDYGLVYASLRDSAAN